MTMVETVARVIHKAEGRDLGKWPEPECPQCMTTARAAIAAMREPTKEMEAAYLDYWSAENVWQAMIDAALNERADT